MCMGIDFARLKYRCICIRAVESGRESGEVIARRARTSTRTPLADAMFDAVKLFSSHN